MAHLHVFDEHQPVETPLGPGVVWFVELENAENWFTCILHNRAIVTFRQAELLAAKDYSNRRGISQADMRDKIAAAAHPTDRA